MDRKCAFYEQIAGLRSEADAVAVSSYDGELTYRELELLSCAAAERLGQRRGEITGLYAAPGRGYIVALMAIARSGAAFMPIDPDLPQKRIERLLEIAGCHTVVTDGLDFPAQAEVVKLDGSKSDSGFIVKAEPKGPAYVMFTSGSTGEPKAVLGNQRGLSHFLAWESAETEAGPDMRVSWLAPVTFDVSLRDMLLPLTNGGTLVIPSEEERTVPHLLGCWLREQRITHVHCVPTVLRLLTQQLDAPLPDLRWLLSAGEPLYGRDILRFWEKAGSGITVVNLYGPTETTLAKCFNKIDADDLTEKDASSLMPVGKPLPGAALLIIKDSRLCAPGEIGEIFIRTSYRSSGYLNGGAFNRNAFVKNPLTGDADDIVYKTGDMGRYLPDMSVECLGRLDSQVKIGGVRIELGEIECALRDLDSVSDAAVVDIKRGGGKFLAAYVVLAEENAGKDADEKIRAELAETLPPAMVPGMILFIDEMPRTTSGKVNRRLLPEPDELFYAASEYVPPTTDAERRLCAIWSGVFGREKIGVTIPFPSFGGDSLTAIKTLSLIYREFSVNISLHDFYTHTDIRGLAQLISSNSGACEVRLEKAPEAESYPLTSVQRRMWALDRMGISPSAYDLPEAFVMEKPLAPELFEKAINAVIERHDSLRTVFKDFDGEPRAVVLKEQRQKIELFGALSEEEAAKRVRENKEYRFDLARGPMLRLALGKLPDGRQLMLFNIHHIISDVTSQQNLLRELSEAYVSFEAGDTWAPDAPKFHFSDFAVWQRKKAESPEYEADKEWWAETLKAPIPVVTIQTDRPRPPVQTFNGALRKARLSGGASEALSAAASSLSVTKFALWSAIIRLVVYKQTGSREMVLGSPVQGRSGADIQDMLGCFINVVPVRGTLDPRMTLRESVSRCAESINEALEHQSVSFDDIVDEIDIERDMSRSPVFDIMFAYVSEKTETQQLAGRALLPFEKDEQWTSARYDLVFHVTDGPQGTEAAINYNTDLYDAERMDLLLDETVHIAETLPLIADARILDISTITEREASLIDSYSRGAAVNYNLEPFPCAIRGYAAKNGSRAAIMAPSRGGVETLGWGSFSERMDSAARFLVSRGVRRGDIVALVGRRSIASSVMIAGIAAAGAVCAPIDAALPEERKEKMLAELRPYLVIRDMGGILTVNGEEYKPGAVQKDEVELPTILPEDSAFILFTSGTTGTPKASVISHKGMKNTSCAFIEAMGLDSESRILQFAGFSFDAAMLNTVNAWYCGGTLVLLNDDIIGNAPLFVKYIRDRGVTSAIIPPVYLKLISKEGLLGGLGGLDSVMSAGEAAPVREALELKRMGVRVFNGYGPSEISVCSSIYEADGSEKDVIPIGTPIPNTDSWLVDGEGHAVPFGAVGEIWVSGAGVSRGYLDTSDTLRSFTLDPLYGWCYRTGDLARRDSAGRLVFCGRADGQVKISGNRIEPEEISTHLRAYPEIADAVVFPLERGGTRVLASWYVVKSGAHITEEELRKRLSAELPTYGVPALYMRLSALPVNANGKVEKSALPEPAARISGGAARGEKEELVLGIWQKLLDREDLGREDSVFAFGADSITAIRFISRLSAAGWRCGVQDIFRGPDAASIAAVIAPVSAAVMEDGNGEMQLSAVQRRFFAVNAPMAGFVQTVGLELPDGVSERVVCDALAALVNRHAMLRSTFPNSATTQRLLTSSLSGVKLTKASDGESLDVFNGRVSGSIDHKNGPVFTAGLYGHNLVLAAHHLVVDGVSWRIIIEELSLLIRAGLSGAAAELPPKTTSFGAWNRMLQRSFVFDGERKWWESELTPVTGKRSAQAEGTAELELDGEMTGKLLDAARGFCGADAEDVILTAVLSEAGELSVLLEGHGRGEETGADVSNTIGWFTSVYPVRLKSEESLARTLCAVKDKLRAAPHGGLGYGVLKYMKGVCFSKERPSVVFNYLGRFRREDNEALRCYAMDSMTPRGFPEFAPVSVTALINDGGGLCVTIKCCASDDGIFSGAGEAAEKIKEALSRIAAECAMAGGPVRTSADYGAPWLSPAELEDITGRYGDDIEEILPLSVMQSREALDLVHNPEIEQPAYVKQGCYRIHSRLDADVFAFRLKRAAMRHPSLRMACLTNRGRDLAVILSGRVPHLRVVEGGKANFEALLLSEREEIRDISKDNLVRFVLIYRDDNCTDMLVTFHHIAFDRWGAEILYRELMGDDLPEVTFKMRDYIARSERENTSADLTWWKKEMSGFEYPCVISPHEHGKGRAIDVRISERAERLRISDTAFHNVERLSVRDKVTLSTLYQTAWSTLLQICTGRDDVVHASTFSMRAPDVKGIDNAVAFFTNSAPVRFSMPASAPFSVRALAFQSKMQEIQDHLWVRSAEIFAQAPFGSGLCDTIFIMENLPFLAEAGEDEPESLYGVNLTVFPLTVTVEGGREFCFNYDPDVTDSEFVSGIAAMYVKILEMLVARPDIPLLEI